MSTMANLERNIENNEANGTKKRKLKIACCSTAYSGHLNPIMSLVEGLAKRRTKTNDDDGSNSSDDFGENEICVVTLCYGANRVESKCQALGVQLVGLPLGEGFDSDAAIKATVQTNLPFLTLADQSKTLMKEALDAFSADVVVSDFACHASQEYAAERNIPLVINWTGPFHTLEVFLRTVIKPANQLSFSAGGLFVSYTPLTLLGVIFFFNAIDFGRMAYRIRRCVNCGNSLVMVNSFWGFEKPRYLFYPNIVPVGSVEKPLPPSPDFSGSHPELHLFLTTARSNQRKILLVSTGTMVKMEEWLVKLLWEAFEKLSGDQNVSIVWSLKEERQEFLTEKQLKHPAFHFSTWLPQPALLASNLLDGVFTHCGWGGTLECIAGEKPVVVLPFFVDQMDNAKLLLAAGCAISVAAIPSFNTDSTGRSSYVGPNHQHGLGFGPSGLREWFRTRNLSRVTVEGVTEGCARLLTDPRYKAAAKRLKAMGTGPGKGREFACDLIEHAGKHGLRHLTESGGTNNSNDMDGGPREATLANKVTGHRPLVFTVAMMCAFAGAAATAATVLAKNATRNKSR